MSAYAVNPETHAVWQYLETDDEELYEREEAEMVRGEEELGLLLAGTKFFSTQVEEYSLIFLTIFNCQLQTSKDPRPSQNSNYTSSDYSSSSASHNGL